MKNYFVLLTALLLALSTQAQTSVFSLAAVPENIKNKASVISHIENINVDVESLDKATVSVHKVFTVVNEDGRSALLFQQYSNKYYTLTDAEIKVYDNKGKVLDKFRKKDMMTTAVGEGLVEDGYVTFYEIKGHEYPITIELNYEPKLLQEEKSPV